MSSTTEHLCECGPTTHNRDGKYDIFSSFLSLQYLICRAYVFIGYQENLIMVFGGSTKWLTLGWDESVNCPCDQSYHSSPSCRSWGGGVDMNTARQGLDCRSQLPCGPKHGVTSPTETLGLWVQVQVEPWMCAPSMFVALRRADPQSKESYRQFIGLRI
jgi:hypothetical protein